MNEHSDSLELSRKLVYLSAERTLSSWLRTALSLMALGFVIDRFSLILYLMLKDKAVSQTYPRILSLWGGSILIGMGAIMALTAGLRYLRFAIAYHREESTRVRNGLMIGAIFSMILALFGVVLVVLLFPILE